MPGWASSIAQTPVAISGDGKSGGKPCCSAIRLEGLVVDHAAGRGVGRYGAAKRECHGPPRAGRGSCVPARRNVNRRQPAGESGARAGRYLVSVLPSRRGAPPARDRWQPTPETCTGLLVSRVQSSFAGSATSRDGRYAGMAELADATDLKVRAVSGGTPCSPRRSRDGSIPLRPSRDRGHVRHPTSRGCAERQPRL